MHTRLEKEENGDLFYCLARVYKFTGQIEEYYEALKAALKNPYTLTFPKEIVQREYNAVEEKLGRHEELEPEAKIPEANEEELSDENAEDDINDENEEESEGSEYESEENFDDENAEDFEYNEDDESEEYGEEDIEDE